MRVLFYGWRNPWFTPLAVIALFSLLFLASTEEVGTTVENPENSTGSSSTDSSSTQSAATTDSTVVTTSGVQTTTSEKKLKIKCTFGIEKDVSVDAIMEQCKKEKNIILKSFWFDISNTPENKINAFLSNLEQIWDGGLQILNNDEIKKIDIHKMTRFGKDTVGGLQIVDTNLEQIDFIADDGTDIKLNILGNIIVHGNRYLHDDTIQKIIRIGKNADVPLLDVQKTGECIVHPNKVDLQHCERVYGDLHLKDTNLAEIEPKFQPKAISGCLMIEKPVILHESTFNELINNKEEQKNNNTCEGNSYVRACIKKKDHYDLTQVFNGTFEDYKVGNCDFTCNMEDIEKHEQRKCTVIDGDIKITNETKVSKEFFENIVTVRGQISIDGTDLKDIQLFGKLQTIESGPEPALIIKNNLNLNSVKFVALNNIHSTAEKWVIVEGNRDFKDVTTFLNKMKDLVAKEYSGDSMDKLQFDYIPEDAIVEERPKTEDRTKEPQTVEKPTGGQSNQGAGDGKPEKIDDKEEFAEDDNSNIAIYICVPLGLCLICAIVVGVAIAVVRYRHKHGKKQDDNSTMSAKPNPPPKPTPIAVPEVATPAPEEPIPVPEVPIPVPEVVGPHDPSEDLLVTAESVALVDMKQTDDMLYVDEKEIAADPTIKERALNLAESMICTPVLFFRMWLQFGTNSMFADSTEQDECLGRFGCYYEQSKVNLIQKVLQAPRYFNTCVKQTLQAAEFVKILKYRSDSHKSDQMLVACGIGITNIMKTWADIPYDWQIIDPKTKPKVDQGKPYPPEGVVEVSYYKLVPKGKATGEIVNLEFHNYTAGSEDHWILGKIDHFSQNVHLARFVLWAFRNKLPFFAVNKHLALLAQLFMVAYFMVFDYKAVAVVNVKHCLHLSIVECAKRLTDNLAPSHHFPPDTGHAYAIQMLKFLMPYVEKVQQTDRHFLGTKFTDIMKIIQKNWKKDEKDPELALSLTKRKRRFRPRDSEKEKPTEPPKQVRTTAGKDEQKAKPQEKQRKKESKNGAQPQPAPALDPKNAPKNDQAAGEKEKSKPGENEKKSEVKSVTNSDVNVQPQPVDGNSKMDVSTIGPVTRREVLSFERNKDLVRRYIANTLTMDNIVMKHIAEKADYIFWEWEWASQAKTIFFENDRIEPLAKRVKNLKNVPDCTQKSK